MNGTAEKKDIFDEVSSRVLKIAPQFANAVSKLGLKTSLRVVYMHMPCFKSFSTALVFA